jgi:hypothetical protein
LRWWFRAVTLQFQAPFYQLKAKPGNHTSKDALPIGTLTLEGVNQPHPFCFSQKIFTPLTRVIFDTIGEHYSASLPHVTIQLDKDDADQFVVSILTIIV